MKSVYNNLLVNNGCPKTAEHCVRVGKEARKIAENNANADSAEIAGYLHDVKTYIHMYKIRVL